MSVQLQLAFSIQKQNGIQWITIQYKFYCQLPPHGGFSETSINSTGNQKKKKKVSQIDYQQTIKKLFTMFNPAISKSDRQGKLLT